MRIFRIGLQKLPTWLKKILSSRPGLEIFERMIAVLAFAGRPSCPAQFFVLQQVWNFRLGAASNSDKIAIVS
jgi:hypothetical protein